MFQFRHTQRLCLTTHSALLIALFIAPTLGLADTAGESLEANDNWRAFEHCPVLVEREVEVPALENGVLEALHVEPNQSIKKGERIGHLDFANAQMSLNAAKLELSVAQKLAADDSDVRYNEIALQEIKEELENLEAINRSVSGSELRRLKLSVGKQEVALIRSRHKRNRDEVTAQLRKSEVEAATQNLKRRAINAPFNGVVTKVQKHAGAYVKAGEAIISIREMEHLLVDRLIARDSVNLSTLIGSPVRIETTGPNGETTWLSGTVTSYDPQVNSRDEIRIHARVTNTEQDGIWTLFPNRYVTMHLEAKHFFDQPEPQILTSTNSVTRESID